MNCREDLEFLEFSNYLADNDQFLHFSSLHIKGNVCSSHIVKVKLKLIFPCKLKLNNHTTFAVIHKILTTNFLQISNIQNILKCSTHYTVIKTSNVTLQKNLFPNPP